MSPRPYLLSRCLFACALVLSVVITFGGGKAANFQVVYRFQGDKYNDGAHPTGGLIADKDGNFFGTTYHGGSWHSGGTVFKLAPDGTETVLHAFKRKSYGSDSFGGVIADSEGTLYGTAAFGGAYGYGVVYRLATDGTETVLHSFSS